MMAMTARTLAVLGPQGFCNLAYWEWAGPPGAPVVLCVHGLTRNGRDFDFLARALSRQYRIVCPDMPGRGQSDWLAAPESYNFPFYLGALAALYARLDVAAIDWVGTSMGGLLGMLFAAQPESPVRRLVLNDIGPAIAPAGLDRIGLYLGSDPTFADRAELEAYLREVHAAFGPLTDAQWRHLALHSGRRRSDGRLALAYDPRIAEAFRRDRESTAQEVDLWACYDAIRAPTLVLRGARSDLLGAADAALMQRRGPKARLVEFAGIGHAPALMADDQIAVIRDFLGAD